MDKRTEILNTFLELIIKNGFHATPMSLVAKTSGIAIGTIYHYFPSKEAIIEELYSSLKEKFGNALKNSYSNDGDTKENFFSICRAMYEYLSRNLSDFLFFEQYSNSPFISNKTKEENLKHFSFAIEMLQNGIKSEKFKNMPVELMFYIVYSNISTFIKLDLRSEIEKNDSLFDILLNSMWDGLRIN
jgi:TetR/AcrR family transcriptional regulator, multidrug resistance operon repressor